MLLNFNMRHRVFPMENHSSRNSQEHSHCPAVLGGQEDRKVGGLSWIIRASVSGSWASELSTLDPTWSSCAGGGGDVAGLLTGHMTFKEYLYHKI